MLAKDSIISSPSVTTVIPDPAPRTSTRPQTPYQVLRLLPKDATPAQQDSAIQAWFEPGEIHYSDQPDTLHLPGHDVARDLKEVNLPQYYRENFFSKDTLYHEELGGGRFGVAGDPVPYSIHDDSIITSGLIACFLVIMFVLSHISGFMVRQTKKFFYMPKEDQSMIETGSEVRFQLLFVFITCLLYALLFYFYANTFIASTYVFSSEYALFGIFTLTLVVYILLRASLYTIVNNIFFDRKKNLQLLGSILFLTSAEAVLLFPSVLLLAYFQFSTQNAIYYCIFILIIIKLLTFYKTHIIFFRQNARYLQNILYFCALEMIPLFVLWNGLVVIANLLKVNY